MNTQTNSLTTAPQKRVLIIDTFNLLFRSYYAMRSFKNANGESIGMLMGLANKLAELGREDFDAVIFAADSPGGSFRNELLPEYKANRKELEPELRAQLPVALNMLASGGYTLIERAGFEADDIIASLAKTAVQQGFSSVVIYSTDKDLFSLINDQVKILGKEGQLSGEAECVEKFGVAPAQMRDYLALIGDSADNFKGVPGVGPAAAKKLLNTFGSIENIYENINLAGTKGLISKLEAGRESALLCQQLATLRDDLDVSNAFAPNPRSMDECYAQLAADFQRWGLFRHFNAASQMAQKLGVDGGAAAGDGAAAGGAGEAGASNSDGAAGEAGASNSDGAASIALGAAFASEFAKTSANASQMGELQRSSREKSHIKMPFTAHLITDENQLAQICEHLPQRVGFDTETTGLDRHARCVGFSFAADFEDGAHAFYVPIAHVGAKNISQQAASAAILQIFSRTVIGHNLAFDFRVIAMNFSLALPARFIDSMVLAWLADSQQRVGLDALCLKLFAHKNVSFSSLVAKGSHFGELAPEKAYFYAAEDAIMALRISEHFERVLSSDELGAAANEMAFLKVLFNMHEAGIAASAMALRELDGECEAEITRLGQEVFALAGREFNIASPKQLAEVLYDELALLAPKNRSTNEAALAALNHPIAPLISAWRSASKLQGTYIRPLLAIAGRASDEFIIHANFMQTSTATGRISCQQPNLQNIPARGVWAQKIKSAFKARAGRLFVGIDYSQIELRMLAHFSGDAALCEAFMNGEDIHARTAIECFGDESKRQLAKAVNFGLIYGMGARALAAEIGASTAEAKRYIDAYFARYPGVQKFFSYTIAHAREHGYIATLAGRRRYFRYGASARENAAHDRECINSVLQGSAADLIKAAMVRASEQLLGADAALVLQVHDELVFEVRAECAEEFAKKAQAIMLNAAALRVPLAASVAIGATLADLGK